MFERRVGNATLVGIVLTSLYIGLLSLYVAMNWRTIFELQPNEVGDFLAGFLGPLAILWLILGYLMQSKELRHSVRALNLQAEELRNSVTHQKELVEVTRSALEQERQMVGFQIQNELERIKPRFTLKRAFSHEFQIGAPEVFQVTNVGGSASSVSIFREEISYWATGETRNFQPGATYQNSFLKCEMISFQDSKGNRYSEGMVVF